MEPGSQLRSLPAPLPGAPQIGARTQTAAGPGGGHPAAASARGPAGGAEPPGRRELRRAGPGRAG